MTSETPYERAEREARQQLERLKQYRFGSMGGRDTALTGVVAEAAESISRSLLALAEATRPQPVVYEAKITAADGVVKVEQPDAH